MPEATDDTTAEFPMMMVDDIDDDSKELIRSKARNLSVDDERVIDNTGNMVNLNDLAMSSMLFDAEIADVHGLSKDTILTVEFQHEVEFLNGDGWLSFVVRYEKPTETVDTITVDASRY